jgi:hypothetical protein
MIKGTPRFDGLTAGEVQVNFLHPTIQMKVKAAFVDTKTGATCGWTEGTQWQPDTIAKLNELRLLLERDLAFIHFSSAEDALALPAKPAPMESGLAEHLSGTDAPSI